jgi:ACS family hexuronate transporter-like MFS transporter
MKSDRRLLRIFSSRLISKGDDFTERILLMAEQRVRIGNFRWVICGLLFLATTINYIDRQVISILKPMILTWPGWSELEYGRVISFFQLAYAAAMIIAAA